jgi:preprotein translocase subunit SecY
MALAEESGENLLLKRVGFTLLLLMVFRLGVHIPTPGVNAKALVALASQNSGGLLKMLNMFSGGALNQFSIFALGIMPYISASIIIQLMTVVVPSLEQLQKEGGVGRQKINRITRTLAVVIALLQGYLAAVALEKAPETAAGAAVLDPGMSFRLLAALLLTSGTCFVMWLGEQITEKGIGNGTSLIIFAGIVAYFPAGIGTVVESLRDNSMNVVTALGLAAFLVGLVFAISFIEQSYRKIAVHYAKRLVGNRVMSGQSTHLPLKVNMSGVIPAIFGSTILAVPLSFGGFFGQSQTSPWLSALVPNQWLYNVFFALLVLFFCFFYTSITFKPDDIAENLKKQNAYIPGVRPGTETAEALDMVVTRLTLAGAVYMNLVCIIPQVITGGFSDQLYVGGTSLLIVVGVALETVRQVSAQLATQRYDSLLFTGKGSESEPKLTPATERSPL